MESPSERERLEKQIMEKAWKVNISPLREGGWLDDAEFEAFLNAWKALQVYYSTHASDSVIGIEVLREYVSYTRLCRRLLLDDEIKAETKEKADEAIGYLEYLMEEIIRDVVTYLDSIGK